VGQVEKITENNYDRENASEFTWREQELARKETELKEKEEALKAKEEIVYKNAKERLYDKIHVSVRTMDVIIFCLIALVVVVIVLGVMAGNG